MKNVKQNFGNTQYKSNSGISNLFNSPSKTKPKIENKLSSSNVGNTKLKINTKLKDFSLSPFKLEGQFPMKINLNEGLEEDGVKHKISTIRASEKKSKNSKNILNIQNTQKDKIIINSQNTKISQNNNSLNQKINNTQNKFRGSFSSDQKELNFNYLHESRNANTTNKLSNEKWSSSTNNLKIEDSVNSLKEVLVHFNLPKKKNSLKIKKHMLLEESQLSSPSNLPRQLEVKNANVRNSTPGTIQGLKQNRSVTYYNDKLLVNTKDPNKKIHHQHSNSLNLPTLYSGGNTIISKDNLVIKNSQVDSMSSNLDKFLEIKQNENKNSHIMSNKNNNYFNFSPASKLNNSSAYKIASNVFTSNLESSKESKIHINKKIINSQIEETSKKTITPEIGRKPYIREVSPINSISNDEDKIKNSKQLKNINENLTPRKKLNILSNIDQSYNAKPLKISKIHNTEEKKLKDNVRFIRTSTAKDKNIKIKKMNQPYSSESNSTNLTASSFKYENNNNSNFNNTAYNFMKKKKDNKFMFSESNNNLGSKEEKIKQSASYKNLTEKKVPFIKNYAYKSQAGKNEHGFTKINQDSQVVMCNVLNLDEYNIFGVLDGHGSNGHHVSNYINKFFNNFFQNIKNYSSSSNSIVNNISNSLNYNSTKQCTNSTREDHSILENKQISSDISQQIREELIYEKLKENNFEVIKNAFKFSENELLNCVKFDAKFSGTTCVLVLIVMNRIICANAGDSRAIIINSSIQETQQRSRSINNSNSEHNKYLPEPLSFDHKPELEEEMKRILRCGGRVEKYNDNGYKSGPFRVWVKNENYPGLAMSRSIGDFVAGSVGVISEPDIVEKNISEETKYIIIASDGVWEFLDNNSVMKIVNPYYIKNDPEGACLSLIKQATSHWEEEDLVVDDITVIVIFLGSK